MPYLSSKHAGGIEIYYESSGSGEPVVLIGGLISTLEAWGLQVPALAPRYRVLRPDNRGSGRTRLHADDGVRSFDRFAGDILALVAGSGEIARSGPDAVAEGGEGRPVRGRASRGTRPGRNRFRRPTLLRRTSFRFLSSEVASRSTLRVHRVSARVRDPLSS